jgi:hypothetical protein
MEAPSKISPTPVIQFSVYRRLHPVHLRLKMLGKSTTARRGNLVSALGMLLAVVRRCCTRTFSYNGSSSGAVIGTLIRRRRGPQRER